MDHKQYIGDSVYVDYDGYPDDPRNRIVLEPDVYSSLLRYVERLKASAKEPT